MKTFGLIGKALSHSRSQQFFTEKFLQNGITDAEYQLFSLTNIEEIKALLKHPTLLGFNVTIPYKSAIIPFLDETDAVSQTIGAVNCVVKENGKWVGYNTDVVGFEKTICDMRDAICDMRDERCEMRYAICDMRYETIRNRISQISNLKSQIKISNLKSQISNQNLKSQLSNLKSQISNLKSQIKISNLKSQISNQNIVLGSGGAAKAVCYILKQKNIPFQIVSRKKTEETITYQELTEELIHQSSLIINTTPLGMFPNRDEKPQIPYSALHKDHILIDLIYNPEETLFLQEGKKRGAVIINGLTMFEAQAEASYLRFKIKNLKLKSYAEFEIPHNAVIG